MNKLRKLLIMCVSIGMIVASLIIIENHTYAVTSITSGMLSSCTVNRLDSNNVIIPSDTPIDRNGLVRLSLSFLYNNDSKPSESNNVFTYQLPAGITSSQTSKSIYDEDTNLMGSYVVKENIITITYDSEWLKNHNSDIRTNMSFDFQLNYDSVKDKDNLSYNFIGSSTPLQIPLKKPTAGGTKDFTVNEDGTYTFKIHITPNADITNLVLKDTLGANLSFNSGTFKLDDTDISDNVSTNNNVATITIDSLPYKSTGYDITYTTTIKSPLTNADVTYSDANNNTGSIQNTNNNASWDFTERDKNTPIPSSDKNIKIDVNWVNKTGIFDATDDTITYTVKINSGSQKFNLDDYTYVDTLTSTNHSYNSAITIKNLTTLATTTIAKPSNTSFSYSDFTGSDEYEITYTTKVDKINVGVTNNCTNDGTIKNNDEEHKTSSNVETTIKPGEISKKEIIENTVIDDGVTKWQVTVNPLGIDASSGLTELKKVTFHDDLGVAWDANNNLSNGNPSITYNKDSLIIKDKDNNIITDYNIVWNDTNTAFDITFDKDMVFTNAITIEYQTTLQKENGEFKHQKYRNQSKVGYYVGDNYYDDSHKKEFDISNNILKKSQSLKWDEELGAYTITWRVYANCLHDYDGEGVTDCGNTLTLTDKLPQGCSLVENQTKYTIRGTTLGYDIVDNSHKLSNDKITITGDDENGYKVDFEIGDDTIPVNKNVVIIEYTTVIDNNYFTKVDNNNDGIIDDKVTFTNLVVGKYGTNGKETIGKATASQDVQNIVLDKNSKVDVDNSKIIHYTVDINKCGADLSKSDTLQLEDVLDPQVSLVIKSFKIFDENENDITAESCQLMMPDATKDGKMTKKMIITVPDETKLTLVYDVIVQLNVGEKANISNEISLKGLESYTSPDNQNYTILQAAAGGSGTSGSIEIIKVDKYNALKGLDGAEFKLYKVNLNDPKDDNGNIKGELYSTNTTSEGHVIFSAATNDGNKPLEMNVLYYFVETKAPTTKDDNGKDYLIDNTPHYVMLKGSGEDLTNYNEAQKLLHQNLPEIADLVSTSTSYNIVNAIKPADGSFSIEAHKKIINQSGEEVSPTTEKFTFSLSASKLPDGVTFTPITSQNSGDKINFDDIKLTKQGNYEFIVSEISAQTANYELDSNQYKISFTVKCADDENKLIVDQDTILYTKIDKNTNETEANELKFVNTHSTQPTPSPTSAQLSISKGLSGNSHPNINNLNNYFTFGIEGVEGTSTPSQNTATNVGGIVTFNSINYELAGDYKYRIFETSVNNHYEYTKSNTEIYALVSITNENNILKSNVIYYSDSEFTNKISGNATITNTYTAPQETSAILKINKTISGENAPLINQTNGYFTFTLTKGNDDAVLPDNNKGTNKNGIVSFDSITYDKVGIYQYKINETSINNHTGFSCATKTLYAQVKVEQSSENRLVTTTSYYSDSSYTTLDNNPEIINEFHNVPEPIKASISLLKLSAVDHTTPLYDAHYGVYSGKECKDNQLLSVIITDKNGKGTTDKKFDPGTYYVQEIKAPIGYTVSTTIFPVVVGTNGENAIVRTNEDEDFVADEQTHVTISKTDIYSNKLSGATLQILDKNKNVIKQWVTEDKIYDFVGELVAGDTYTLHEVASPNGYEIANDIEFNVDEYDGNVTNVVMIDKRNKNTLIETGDNETIIVYLSMLVISFLGYLQIVRKRLNDNL